MSYRITFSNVAVDDIGKMSKEIYSACLDKKTAEEYVNNLLKKINEKAIISKTYWLKVIKKVRKGPNFLSCVF